jgi:hypothetical protein
MEEVSSKQISVAEVRSGEGCMDKLRPGETGAGEDSPREGRPSKIGFSEIDVGEVGAAEVGRRKIGLTKVGPTEVGITKVGRLEIHFMEVGPSEVWSNALVLTPPLIPRLDTLLQDLELLLVRHRSRLPHGLSKSGHTTLAHWQHT